MHSNGLSPLAFIKKTGSMGMGFDYTFINDPSASAYSQWAGWRRILSTVLAEGPAGLQVIPPIATLLPPLCLVPNAAAWIGGQPAAEPRVGSVDGQRRAALR